MWYFYIFQSAIESDYFYKGSNGDLKLRFKQHSNGKTQSTKSGKSWRLVYYEAYLTEKVAKDRESAIKENESICLCATEKNKK